MNSAAGNNTVQPVTAGNHVHQQPHGGGGTGANSGSGNNNNSNNSATDTAIHSLVDELLVSVTEVKHGLEQLLIKVDSGAHVSSLLDSLSVTSGQLNMLCRKLALPPGFHTHSSSQQQQLLQQSKYSLLNSIVFSPQNLSIEQDARLAELTQDRARCFDHELVPLYLRTKLIPSLENKVQILAQEAAKASGQQQDSKQSSTVLGSNGQSAQSGSSDQLLLKKIVEDLSNVMMEVETELKRSEVTSTLALSSCTPSDTAGLLAMVTEGRGLKGPVGGYMLPNAGMKSFPNATLAHHHPHPLHYQQMAVAAHQQQHGNPMQQHMMQQQGQMSAVGRSNMQVGPHNIPPVVSTTIVKPIIR